MTKLPKSKENYVDSVNEIRRGAWGESQAVVDMLGLLVEAVVDLKEVIEPIYTTEQALEALED